MENILKIEGYELLSQKVYRLLKSEIIKGSLKPGIKLLEEKIAKQLEVSRTPIREALKQLAAEGFVKITPNFGVDIIEFSHDDLCEVLQIRKVLEGLAASIAAKKISEEEITKLEEITKKMSISISKPKPNIVAYGDLNAKFHNLIFNVCGNKRLTKICNNLSSSDHRFRIRALRNDPERLKYSLIEHQEIVEALMRKKSEQADRMSQKHVKNILANILAQENKGENIYKNA
jgi:DNA-binding GntR family transcriptional regulator